MRKYILFYILHNTKICFHIVLFVGCFFFRFVCCSQFTSALPFHCWCCVTDTVDFIFTILLYATNTINSHYFLSYWMIFMRFFFNFFFYFSQLRLFLIVWFLSVLLHICKLVLVDIHMYIIFFHRCLCLHMYAYASNEIFHHHKHFTLLDKNVNGRHFFFSLVFFLLLW